MRIKRLMKSDAVKGKVAIIKIHCKPKKKKKKQKWKKTARK